jgi:hypothetical protein
VLTHFEAGTAHTPHISFLAFEFCRILSMDHTCFSPESQYSLCLDGWLVEMVGVSCGVI